MYIVTLWDFKDLAGVAKTWLDIRVVLLKLAKDNDIFSRWLFKLLGKVFASN